MCAVSNISDYGQKQWPAPMPGVISPFNPYQNPAIPPPYLQPNPLSPPPYTGPTKEQFEEFLTLLRAAKRFDEATGQPDCIADDKLAWLKAIAQHLGVPEPKL